MAGTNRCCLPNAKSHQLFHRIAVEHTCCAGSYCCSPKQLCKDLEFWEEEMQKYLDSSILQQFWQIWMLEEV